MYHAKPGTREVNLAPIDGHPPESPPSGLGSNSGSGNIRPSSLPRIGSCSHGDELGPVRVSRVRARRLVRLVPPNLGPGGCPRCHLPRRCVLGDKVVVTTASDPSGLPAACRKALNAALEHPSAFPQLLEALKNAAPFEMAIQDEAAVRLWQSCAVKLIRASHFHDATDLLQVLYHGAMVTQGSQRPSSSVKGTALVWLAEAHLHLGHRALAQRYAVLTLCEDAIGAKGEWARLIGWGGYWRARLQFGVTDHEAQSLVNEFWQAFQVDPTMGRFPEWVLQQVDERWRTELPATSESGRYQINRHYARELLNRLGSDKGTAFELLAQYLFSSIPGWRTRRRVRTPSTDYDVMCTLEGVPVDFRGDLGRFVVCECKDWSSPINFGAVAKFARVLQSAKCRCGILLSRNGVTGRGHTGDAARELIKVYQDTGIAILVLDLDDLNLVVDGANLIQVLRDKYEQVRLDTLGRVTRVKTRHGLTV